MLLYFSPQQFWGTHVYFFINMFWILRFKAPDVWAQDFYLDYVFVSGVHSADIYPSVVVKILSLPDFPTLSFPAKIWLEQVSPTELQDLHRFWMDYRFICSRK